MTTHRMDESRHNARSVPGIRSCVTNAKAFVGDLRIAARSLRRVPTLWITVAFTLALGIGANAAIFSIVRGVLLRPLVNRDEHRLIYIQQSAPGLHVDDATFSIPEIQDIGARLRTIRQLGTFSTVSFTLEGLGEPREIRAGVVDGHYFEVMGLRAIVGRLLDARDDGPTAAGAAVFTYNFWVNSLHADRGVIGKVIRLGSGGEARSAVIVGVLEPSIPYPVKTELIANVVTSPHHLSATMVTGREHRMTEVFGRLAPEAEIESARAELHAVYSAMVAAHPEVYKTQYQFRIDARRLRDEINARAKTTLWLLLGASTLLFVIACANVANLILARTVRRETELAIRAALGASSTAIRRTLLAEALVLCGSSGLVGVWIAVPMFNVLARYVSSFSVRAGDIRLDFSALWIGFALGLGSALFLAFVPRLPWADSSRGLILSSASVRVTGGSRRRLRIFAISQIAASFLLLASASVLLSTLFVLQKAQPGFRTARVLIANLPLISEGGTPQQVADFYQDAQRNLSALPGVESVATGMSAPWRDGRFLGFTLQFSAEGGRRESGKDELRARFRSVSPSYFATLGIPLLEGRDFTEADRPGSELVVIISNSIAQQLFPGQTALNHQLQWTDPLIKYGGISPAPRRIVGVVADLDDESIIPAPNMTVYQPFAQGPVFMARLLVRAHNDPYQLVPTITRSIHVLASTQPVERASTLEDVRAEVLSTNRLNAIVFGGFAGLALAISVVGVAGVVAFSVSWRMREFGIRLALGAHPARILAGVLIDGTRTATIGVTAGVLVGWGLSRLVGNYVQELQLPGPVPLIGSAALILMAVVLASMVPALRAARVDTIQALRVD